MNLFFFQKVIFRYILFILAVINFFLTFNIFMRNGNVIFFYSVCKLLLDILFELFQIVFKPFQYLFDYYLRCDSASVHQVVRGCFKERISIKILRLNQMMQGVHEKSERVYIPLSLNHFCTSLQLQSPIFLGISGNRSSGRSMFDCRIIQILQLFHSVDFASRKKAFKIRAQKTKQHDMSWLHSNYKSSFAPNINKMLKQQFRELKGNSVLELCQSPSDSEAVLLQVYNIAIAKNGKITCYVSDGNHCVKAFLKQSSPVRPEKHENALIRVKQHVVGDSGKIGIIDLDLVCEYNHLIGNPKPFNLEAMQNPEDIKPYHIELKNITNKHFNIMEEKSKPQNQPQLSNRPQHMSGIKREEMKREEKKQMRTPVGPARPLNGNVKDYESIKDLFIGLRGWHLLCRITRLEYSEFQKKNSDKLVKILNIDLIDRSEVKISGVFFYEAAEKFRDELKLNSVYKISEGSITSENYNNTRNDKMSAYRLIFGENAIFEEVSDVNIIARPEDSAISLGELLNKPVYDQQFDIIGILVEIEEPKQINKEGKVLVRWNWVIADPITQKRIHATLWNDRIKHDVSLIGKTIMLSHFTLHDYKGSLNLSSKARSFVQPVTQHKFREYESKVMTEHKNYELLSERRTMGQDDNQGVFLTNLKELNDAVQYLPMGETLKSELNVLIGRFLMKKWFYESCPGCNKSAEKGTTCHCGKYVEETVPRFILTVELADAFGSVWTTAYDEQSKRIFWEEEGVIHKLMRFDQNQIKEVVEDYLYQQFHLRIYTKKDDEGRIKHNLGKMEVRLPERVAQDNLEKIRLLMNPV